MFLFPSFVLLHPLLDIAPYVKNNHRYYFHFYVSVSAEKETDNLFFLMFLSQRSGGDYILCI